MLFHEENTLFNSTVVSYSCSSSPLTRKIHLRHVTRHTGQQRLPRAGKTSTRSGDHAGCRCDEGPRLHTLFLDPVSPLLHTRAGPSALVLEMDQGPRLLRTEGWSMCEGFSKSQEGPGHLAWFSIRSERDTGPGEDGVAPLPATSHGCWLSQVNHSYIITVGVQSAPTSFSG